MKRRTISAAIGVALIAGHGATFAGPSDYMYQTYDDMSNYSEPGKFESATRTGFSGGRITTRSPTKTIQPLQIDPPSIEAGCGGIDIHGGNFSYIDKDQFVEFARQVGSNAQGYLFQLALDAVCPECSSLMQAFQKTVQEINNMELDSCQMAQGIVDGGANAMGWSDDFDSWGDAAADSDVGSALEGIQEAWTEEDTKDKSPESYSERIGNLAYHAVMETNIKDMWEDLEDDDFEIIQSLTGTVIRQEVQGSGEDASTPPIEYQAKIGIEELAFGEDFEPGPDGEDELNDIEIWGCDGSFPGQMGPKGGSPCDSLSPKTIDGDDLGALAPQINEALEDAVLAWASNGADASLSNSQKAVIGNLPSGVARAIRDLSIINPATAFNVSKDVSEYVALRIAADLADEILDTMGMALRKANAEQDLTELRDAMELFRERRTEIADEYAEIKDRRDLTSTQHVLERHSQLAQYRDSPRYLSAEDL